MDRNHSLHFIVKVILIYYNISEERNKKVLILKYNQRLLLNIKCAQATASHQSTLYLGVPCAPGAGGCD